MKHLSILFLITLIWSCDKPAPSAESRDTKVFQTVLDSIYQQHPDAVGILAHIEAPDQQLSWSGAAGFSDKSKAKALEVDQPALLASNTKTFVSAAILRLVEEGEIALDDAIDGLISEKTQTALEADGYALDAIRIVNLLSHTSGIYDYVYADTFFAMVRSQPKHRWTRDEQIALAMSEGDPLAKAGETYRYADINYLLLGEIIEKKTGKPFYTSMRELLDYQGNGFGKAWFYTLEDDPVGIKPMAHQYSAHSTIDSYDLDPSFDLFGGGGLAGTPRDLALFSQSLFENKLFKKPETLDLIYTKVATQDSLFSNYYLGLASSETAGRKTYGHGGFWATTVQYIPSLNASVSVFVLDKEQGALRYVVLGEILGSL
ncbi:MAG: serine hydrolase domain-containing protein [Bacteroidia bacterium]